MIYVASTSKGDGSLLLVVSSLKKLLIDLLDTDDRLPKKVRKIRGSQR